MGRQRRQPTGFAASDDCPRVLRLCAGRGTERLMAYIEHGVPANLTDATGNTLLMLAAHHGHAETVRALVDMGADPDRTNDVVRVRWPGDRQRRGRGSRGLVGREADPDVGTPSAAPPHRCSIAARFCTTPHSRVTAEIHAHPQVCGTGVTSSE